MAKKNLLKIPKNILNRVRSYDQDDVVIACVKSLKSEDILRYSHLGLSMEHGELKLPNPAVPNPSAGRYSRANVEGYEKRRADLPKIQKEYSFEAPDWGDWSNGSHTVSWTRDIYQRDFYPPKEVELSVTLLKKKEDGYVVKFTVEQVINRRMDDFEQELLYNLNILQENVGAVDVFSSAASLAEYTATIQVDWQIFPPGTVDNVVEKMLKGKRGIAPEEEKIMRERILVMSEFNPEVYVTGTDNFLRYFGAKFGNNFIVFENIHYGNAIYVMHDKWQELTKKSRVELLKGPREKFERIEHRDGWEGRLRWLVSEYRAS